MVEKEEKEEKEEAVEAEDVEAVVEAVVEVVKEQLPSAVKKAQEQLAERWRRGQVDLLRH